MSAAAMGVRDFVGADRVEGPILVVEGAVGAAFGEVVEVFSPQGAVRLGRVLETSEKRAVVELWGESAGLRPSEVRVRFGGHSFQVPVSREMLGRVFDGLGRPRDGLPAPLAEARVDANGAALNPVARSYPHDLIQTGIAAIDGMNTLVRGQKLPLFSGAGLPHNELAAQIAGQTSLAAGADDFALVFVALGASHDTADFFYQSFAATGSASPHRALPEPGRRLARGAHHHAACGAEPCRASGLCARLSCARHPDGHDQLCRGPA